MDVENQLSNLSTYDLEQELNVRYKNKRMLQAIIQFERATGKDVMQATQTEQEGTIKVELEFK